MKTQTWLGILGGVAAISLAHTPDTHAQIRPTFSIDVQSITSGLSGPMNGAFDGWGLTRIDEGSILTPAIPGPPGPNVPNVGPLPLPGVMATSVFSPAGTVPGGLGLFQAQVELDALSYGHDHGLHLMFSVDEWAAGDFLAPLAPPNVFSEGAWPTSNMEAAADVFVYNGAVMRTPPPAPGTGPGNQLVIDGNGVAPPPAAIGLPGLGLIEPMPAGCGIGCEGDNLDALDINTQLPDVQGLVYFSLDSDFPDPLDFPTANTGTASINGFSGGDVLVNRIGAGTTPWIYASANTLGLDLIDGFDTDDLDALILQDDGDGQFDPAVDRILFSVRRGSSVIGQPDSLYGKPIEEGDVLSIPSAAGGFPSIYIAAEALGLATVRSGTVELTPYGDELDALDLFLPGDLNGDGFVGLDDLDIILLNWNQFVPPANPAADPTGDGFVGLEDLDVVLNNWNTGSPLPPGGVAIPEPTSLALLSLGGLLVMRHRR